MTLEGVLALTNPLTLRGRGQRGLVVSLSVIAGASMRTDPMREIFDRTEELTNAIATASGCTGALSLLQDQIKAEPPDLLTQASAVASAIDMYLAVARRHADGIARLTFDQPET